MKKIKWLGGDFKEVKHAGDACYGIHEDGDVELVLEKEREYPIISAEEILKLAEILKEEK